MSHRDNRFSMTPMPHDPAVLGRQARIGISYDCQGGFRERDPELPVPLSGLALLVFPGAFVVVGNRPVSSIRAVRISDVLQALFPLFD